MCVCACLGFLLPEPSLYFCQESVASSCSSLLILIKCLSSEGIYLYFAQLALLLLCNSPQSSAIRLTALSEFHIWSPQSGTTSDFFVLLFQLSSLVYLVFIEGIGIGSLGQLVFGYWVLVLGTDIGIGDWFGYSVERILG